MLSKKSLKPIPKANQKRLNSSFSMNEQLGAEKRGRVEFLGEVTDPAYLEGIQREKIWAPSEKGCGWGKGVNHLLPSIRNTCQ